MAGRHGATRPGFRRRMHYILRYHILGLMRGVCYSLTCVGIYGIDLLTRLSCPRQTRVEDEGASYTCVPIPGDLMTPTDIEPYLGSPGYPRDLAITRRVWSDPMVTGTAGVFVFLI